MIEWIQTERNGVDAMIIEGIVEQGKHLGRRLGFPTANLSPRRTEGAWPPNGVYACAAWIDGERGARPCMLNQGVHPTAPEGKPTVEAHILDYDGDAYGGSPAGGLPVNALPFLIVKTSTAKPCGWSTCAF